jgi:hypothetical protein
MKIIILKGLSLIMSSAACCSSVHQRPGHLKTKKSYSLNLLVVKTCRNSFQDFFLGLENSLNSRNFKKKTPRPDANKMEKQVQKVQMMLTEGEDYSSQLSVHIFSTCTHLP